MPEKPAAVEHSENTALRDQVCAECSNARAELDGLIQIEKAPDIEQRRAELLPWVAEHLPDFVPQDLVVEICLQIEQDEAAAGFPGFRVDSLPAHELREEVLVFMAETQADVRNQATTGQIENGVPAKVPAQTGRESSLIVEENRLEADNKTLNTVGHRARNTKTNRLENREEKDDRNAELKKLQASFDGLRANGIGTVAALRHVIAKAENSETKTHLNNLLGRVALLQTALPGKPEVVDRLLNRTGLNLAATTVAGSFADFITVAETDGDLTDSDRATLRQIIFREEHYARTGTQVQTELGQTLTTADGQIVPVHPEDKPYQFRDHVAGFTQPDGSQHLRATATHGERVTLDITGWSGADIGRASELLQLWAMTENEGQTDYLTSITKLNWTDTAQIDPITLQKSAQIVSAMLGHGEGHDGDIFESQDALGVIRWQAQLANLKGGTLRGNRDAKQTNDALVGLGIRDKDGNLDFDVLRAFGDYSRDNWNIAPDYEAVRTHLANLFPNKFK